MTKKAEQSSAKEYAIKILLLGEVILGNTSIAFLFC